MKRSSLVIGAFLSSLALSTWGGEPARCLAFVRSDPDGATVLLGLSEIEFGKTPCLLRDLPAVGIPLKIELEGYWPHTGTLALRPGRVARVTVRLEKVKTGLQVKSRPRGAEVYVDGTSRGLTPTEIRGIPPGRHQVKLKKEGYRAWETEVNISPGGGIITVEGQLVEGLDVESAGPAAAERSPREVEALGKQLLPIRELIAAGRYSEAQTQLLFVAFPADVREETSSRLERILGLRKKANERLRAGTVEIALRSIAPQSTVTGGITEMGDSGVKVISKGPGMSVKVSVHWNSLSKGAHLDLIRRCLAEDDVKGRQAFVELAAEAGDLARAAEAVNELKQLGADTAALVTYLGRVGIELGRNPLGP